MTPSNYGALPEEWASAMASPLAPWLIPIVSNPALPQSAKSNIERGKVPSIKNASGKVTGLANWPSKAPNKKTTLNTWAADPDYGFGCRLGHDGLIALDCDIDNPELASAILGSLSGAIGVNSCAIPLRKRNNARWATILRITGGEIKSKRIYAFSEKEKLEVLTNGQQLACAGTHPSGNRYKWENGRVGDVIDVSLETLESFFNTLELMYGATPITSRASERKKGPSYAATDRLAEWLRPQALSEGRDGELYIECPWRDTHTDGAGGATSTVYFPIGSNGYDHGGFRCLHAHCQNKTLGDFIEACKKRGYTELNESDYPDMEAARLAPKEEPVKKAEKEPQTVKLEPSTAQLLQRYVIDTKSSNPLYKHGIDPCPEALKIALSDPAYCGQEIAFDTFAASPVIRPYKSKNLDDWQRVEDEDISDLQAHLEELGFRKNRTAKDKLRDQLQSAARRRKFDYMKEYLAANIPEWDGVERVAGFFTTYCGADESEWTKAVARYLFSALWARASIVDGVKADIAVVLVGAQGTGKTTLTRILALDEKWCGELDFTLTDADLARAMRQKVIMEIPELGGMSKREQNGVKAFITRTHDHWIPKFREAERTAARRCLFVMTTNDRQFLTDRTGNRRWAPIEVGEIDREAVQKDILQLWAEGRELFKQNGIMFADVEKLQTENVEKYVAPDLWEEMITEWLETRETDGDNLPVTTKNLVKYALGLEPAGRGGDSNSRRVSAIMDALGYEETPHRVDGHWMREWVKKFPF